MKRLFTMLLPALLCGYAQGQGRLQQSINDGWKFYPEGISYAETISFNDQSWERVNLPHTWNAEDVFDDDLHYRRGISWYRKQLKIDSSLKGGNVYLYFEGANQLANVYVNGYFAGQHKGGYTGFSVDATPYINWKGSNTLAVQVSNAHDPFIPPLNVGYASYGGIYRDVWMIGTGSVHFKDINNNSGGVYISSPKVSTALAEMLVRTDITNTGLEVVNAKLVNTITDAQGTVIKRFEQSFNLAASGHANISTSSQIETPRLWSPESPYLYTVRTEIWTGNKLQDVIENKYGFRWFSFEAGKGFMLNGQPYKLRGTNRHQDMKGKGDALTMADHRRDMQLIKDMGANFLRLAHYPQAAEVLKLADELGLLIWEETPVVNFITTQAEFTSNATTMLHEMISQGYNHPSVIMWGSSNEIFLHGKEGERIGKQNNDAYAKAVRSFVGTVDSFVRKEDPTRYSTMAMHMSGDYKKYGLDTVAQVAGFNIYDGWYSGKVEDLGPALDRMNQIGKPILISEYGAEGEVRLNSERPVRFDYSGQYQRYYHESYLRQFKTRPWLAGTAVWNEFDFSQPNIGGPAKHMNQKGLITWDRKPKDAYYLYQANWSSKPMVHIASRDWPVRAGTAGQLNTIDVYSNAKQVTLYLNGVKQSTQTSNDLGKTTWKLKLKDGTNVLRAEGANARDEMQIEYQVYKPGNMSINVGSDAQYVDPAGIAWVEDRAYTPASFGYTGGTWKAIDRKDPIMHTQDEPMFLSYIDSVKGYRFDVPDGQYRITVCFAEGQRLKPGERVFETWANGILQLPALDLTSEHGFTEAVYKTFITEATKGQGVTIEFKALKGGAILNGIRIEKL